MERIIAIMLGTLALVANATMAIAATTPGSPDPTFGTAGKVSVNPTTSIDDWGGGVLQPDGKLVVTGYATRTASTYSIAAVRLLDNGALDPTFGAGGIASLAIDQDSGADSNAPALDASGRILIAGYSLPDTLYRCSVVALLPNGARDPSFGDAGVFRLGLKPGKDSHCVSIATQSDKIIVLAVEDGSPNPASLLRLTAAGVIDTTFAGQGIVALPLTGNLYWRSATIGADGSIFVTGGDNINGYVMKFTSAGVLDTSYATGGTFQTPFANSGLYPPKVLADGGLLIPGYHGSKHLLLRLAANGALAPSFGAGGVAEFSFGTGYSAIGVDVQKDGKIVAGLRLKTDQNTWKLAALRLNADGTPDTSYGTGGLAVLGSAGIDEVTYGIALAPDGKLWLFGRADFSGTDSGLAVGRILGTEITTNTVEFFNIDLKHYFITADPNEAAAIDGGAAGPGWSRTGQTWKSGGPNRVCRFYGSPDTNPATGSRAGPNSHFYTIEAAECAAVRLDPGWRFESYDFNGWPTSAGSCPTGTVAVKRVYNNRFAQNDSNHRYVTNDVLYAQMISQNWNGEGVVFCAVQ